MALRLAAVPALLLVVAGSGACASAPRGATERAYEVRTMGEPYRTPRGDVHLIRVQDEYRMIRCIPSGPIAGCYEDVFTLPRSGVPWNQWLPVTEVPGLRLAFLTPDSVALRYDGSGTSAAAAAEPVRAK